MGTAVKYVNFSQLLLGEFQFQWDFYKWRFKTKFKEVVRWKFTDICLWRRFLYAEKDKFRRLDTQGGKNLRGKSVRFYLFVFISSDAMENKLTNFSWESCLFPDGRANEI